MYRIIIFVNDNRPVAPLHLCNVITTLDDAKQTVDRLVSATRSIELTFSPWEEQNGMWYRETQGWGYGIEFDPDGSVE